MLPADVCITYALLLSAIALDAAALTMLLFSDWTLLYFVHESSKYSKRLVWLAWLANASRMAKRWWTVRRWSRMVSQMNFLDDLPELTISERVREIFYDFIPTAQADDLMLFIFKEMKDAVSKAKDPEQIKKLSDCRGDRFLGQLVWEAPSNFNVILSSVTERDFDESLLMWHIATNLCFPVRPMTELTDKMWSISKKLSDYMLYLLIKNPEMMSATMGIGLLRYRSTCAVTRQLLVRDFARELLRLDYPRTFLDNLMESDRTKTLIFSAYLLAKALRELDDELTWEVMAKVWTEMLTYAAFRTPPREHLAQLSHGGELITLVWLLMEHMGLSSSTIDTRTDIVPKLIVQY